jgi:hypothetical protein
MPQQSPLHAFLRARVPRLEPSVIVGTHDLKPFRIEITQTSDALLSISVAGDDSRPGFALQVQASTSPEELCRVLEGALTPAALLAEKPVAALAAASASGAEVRLVPAAQQWHNNACGYHALHNAVSMLQGERVLSEDALWSRVAWALALLRQHAARTGMWQSNNLEAGVLDAAHLRHVVEQDPELRRSLTVCMSCDELRTLAAPAFDRARALGLRHALVLGLESHWIAVCLAGADLVLIADAHNKRYTSLSGAEDCFFEAQRLVEAYRPQVRVSPPQAAAHARVAARGGAGSSARRSAASCRTLRKRPTGCWTNCSTAASPSGGRARRSTHSIGPTVLPPSE